MNRRFCSIWLTTLLCTLSGCGTRQQTDDNQRAAAGRSVQYSLGTQTGGIGGTTPCGTSQGWTATDLPPDSVGLTGTFTGLAYDLSWRNACVQDCEVKGCRESCLSVECRRTVGSCVVQCEHYRPPQGSVVEAKVTIAAAGAVERGFDAFGCDQWRMPVDVAVAVNGGDFAIGASLFTYYASNERSEVTLGRNAVTMEAVSDSLPAGWSVPGVEKFALQGHACPVGTPEATHRLPKATIYLSGDAMELKLDWTCSDCTTYGAPVDLNLAQGVLSRVGTSLAEPTPGTDPFTDALEWNGHACRYPAPPPASSTTAIPSTAPTAGAPSPDETGVATALQPDPTSGVTFPATSYPAEWTTPPVVSANGFASTCGTYSGAVPTGVAATTSWSTPPALSTTTDSLPSSSSVASDAGAP